MSDVRPLALDGGGPGLRAALVGPRGADEALKGDAAVPAGLFKDGGLGDVCDVAGLSSGVVGFEEVVDEVSESMFSAAVGWTAVLAMLFKECTKVCAAALLVLSKTGQCSH